MLVLCCGNPDRGDDAAGLLVARRLRKLGIDCLEHSGEGLSLLEAWQGADEVVLVDAVVTGRPAGAVSVWDALAAPLAGWPLPGSSHALGLAEAVALGRVLGRLPRRVTLYGIEARRFELGKRPGRALLRGVVEVAKRIRADGADRRPPV
jgi:hydrogenase maturation protease